MAEQFSSALQGRRLLAAITDSASTLSLNTVPDDLTPGRYRLRIDAEILTGLYTSGLVFSSLARGLEGTTAASHRGGVNVRHIVSGESIQKLLTIETATGTPSLEGVRKLVVADGALSVDGTTATIVTGGVVRQPPMARPVASRLYLFLNFS